MTGKEFRYVLQTIENEGSLEYTFVNYSDFENIKDEEFHKLRMDYLDARAKLADFIGLETK